MTFELLLLPNLVAFVEINFSSFSTCETAVFFTFVYNCCVVNCRKLRCVQALLSEFLPNLQKYEKTLISESVHHSKPNSIYPYQPGC